MNLRGSTLQPKRPSSVRTDRRSSGVIEAIFELHFPVAKTAVDPTYGKGNFWKWEGRPEIWAGDVAPSVPGCQEVDCRSLPLEDKSYDVGVIDLPFMHDSRPHSGTNLYEDYKGLGSYQKFVNMTADAAMELSRVCRMGYIIKCKDGIESGKFRPIYSMLIQEVGVPFDVVIYVPPITLANDPKWHTIKHFRRQESYFLIYKYG